MYPPFAESCEASKICGEQGWSVLQYAMPAVVDHRELALQKANALPSTVFESAGGNRHSKTNTLWYIATRPDVAEPLVLSSAETRDAGEEPVPPSQPGSLVCGCPEACTPSQLDMDAGGCSCRSRIQWLMTAFGKTEKVACRHVAGTEFSNICRGCNLDRCAMPPPPSPGIAGAT